MNNNNYHNNNVNTCSCSEFIYIILTYCTSCKENKKRKQEQNDAFIKAKERK